MSVKFCDNRTHEIKECFWTSSPCFHVTEIHCNDQHADPTNLMYMHVCDLIARVRETKFRTAIDIFKQVAQRATIAHLRTSKYFQIVL